MWQRVVGRVNLNWCNVYSKDTVNFSRVLGITSSGLTQLSESVVYPYEHRKLLAAKGIQSDKPDLFFFFSRVSRFNTETPLSSNLGSLGTSESFSFCSVTSMYVLP